MKRRLTRLACWWHGHQWRHEDEDVYCNRIRCARCEELFIAGRRWDSYQFDVFAEPQAAALPGSPTRENAEAKRKTAA